MKTLRLALGLALSTFALAACDSSVTFDDALGDGNGNLNGRGDGDGGAGGEGEEGGVSTSSGAPGIGGAAPTEARLPALARTRAQNDALWDAHWESQPSGNTGSSSSGGPALDPNDLFLQIADVGVACDEVHVDLPCGGHWSVSIGVPPALQKPGLYNLTDSGLELYSGMSETGELYSSDPDDCSWGGGSIGEGTLEIVSIDGNEVKFVLDVETWFDSDPSGAYTALRCP